MKKTTKRFGTLLLGLTLVFGAFSCQPPAPDDSNIVKYEATLNAANTSPRATSSAVGSATLEFDKNTKMLRYNITFQGITPDGGNIRIEPLDKPKESKLVEFGSAAATSPITGSIPLRDDFEALMRFGILNISLTTPEYPEGEISGRIRPSKYGDD